MAGMPAPDITQAPRSPLVERAWGRDGAKGGMSDEQLDAVLRITTAWEKGHGMLIADDVGVGKSREAAGAILEAIARGAKRIIYLTKNETNLLDAEREFRAVASGREDGDFPATFIKVADYPSVKKGEERLPTTPGPAVYLVHSYNFASFAAGLTELDPDTLIGDEAHEFKNLFADRGMGWRALHEQMLRRKDSRFAYFTATPGVSLDELGYLFGLREWAVGGFSDWVAVKLGKKEADDAEGDAQGKDATDAEREKMRALGEAGADALASDDKNIQKGSKGFMRMGGDVFAAKVTPAETEQVMRELKGGGKYISRDLWRGGVAFDVETIDLLGDTAEARAARARYDQAAQLARDISETAAKFGRMNKKVKTVGLDRALLQSYMKQLLFDLRWPRVIALADEALKAGKQVVISVHSIAGDADLEEGVSAADAEIPLNKRLESAISRINTQHIEKEGQGADAEYVDLGEIPEALMAVSELRDRLRTLPPLRDPLRAIEEHFGAKHVALITGKATAKRRKTLMGEFQSGHRRVALISKAGKVGISLHDVNGRQRRMIVADYEWSADTFKQELGRVDRTGQKTSPEVTLVASNIAGERKFAATIAARMASLGATSKGSSEATGTEALDQFDVADNISLFAMKEAYERLIRDPVSRYFTSSKLFEWRRIGTSKTFERTPKRNADNKAGMRDYLLDLLLFPVQAADQVWALWTDLREQFMTQEAAQKHAAKKTGRLAGEITRSTPLVEGPRPITLVEVKNDEGERRAIVQGFVTEYIARIQNARGTDSEGRLPSRRYVQFTSHDGQLVAGLELAPGEARRVKEDFGKGDRAFITPADAWADLEAGDKVAVHGIDGEVWYLRKRRVDDKVAIDGTTLSKHGRKLQGTGAKYSAVGNFLYIDGTQEAFERFVERFKIRQPTGGGAAPQLGLGDVMSEARTGAGRAGMDVNKERLADTMSANVYAGSLPQIIVKEAIQNAIDAIRPRGRGTITVTLDEKARRIVVEDDGTGMSPDTATGAYLDAFDSEKPEGASGGLGIAKAALFRHADPFRTQTIAEVDGRKVLTTVEGTGRDWITGNLEVNDEVVDDDAPTGTVYEVTLDAALPSSQAQFYSARDFLEALRKNSRLPDIKIVVNDVREGAFKLPRERPSIVPEAPAAFLEPEGAKVAVFVDPEPAPVSVGYVAAHILNNGYHQFTEYLKFGKNAPAQVWLDVKATVPVTDPSYPFTIDRSKLKDAVKDAVERHLQTMGKGAEADHLGELVRALADAPTIQDSDAKVYATSGNVPRAVAAKIARRRYAWRVAALWRKAGQAIMARVQRRRELDAPSFAGLGIGDSYLAVNVLRSALFDRAKELGVSIGDDQSNLVLVNPFNIVIEASTLSKEHAADAEYLADQMWGALVHEIAHQNQRGHTEGFAGEFTRIESAAARVQGEFIEMFDTVWAALIADPEFQADLAEIRQAYQTKDNRFKGYIGHDQLERQHGAGDRPEGAGVSGESRRGDGAGDAVLGAARDGRDRGTGRLAGEGVVSESRRRGDAEPGARRPDVGRAAGRDRGDREPAGVTLHGVTDPVSAAVAGARELRRAAARRRAEHAPLVEAALPEIEQRWQQARGVRPESWREKMRAVLEAARKLTRHFPEIDPARSPLDATVHELLLEHERAPKWAQAVAYDRLAAITEGLAPNEVDLMTRALALRDLQKDVDRGLYHERTELPFGYTRETLADDLAAVEDAIRGRPAVAEAIERRQAFVGDLTRQMVAADLLDAKVLEDDRYYHRQVMAYVGAQPAGFGKGKDVRQRERGFQKGRVGGGDFNTRYEQAEFEWVAQALTELKTHQTLGALKELADQTRGLKALAKRTNLERLGAKLRVIEERENPVDPREPHELVGDFLAPHSQSIAVANDFLMDALERDGLPAGVRGFDDLMDGLDEARREHEAAEADRKAMDLPSEPMQFDHPAWWRFVAALASAEGDHRATIAARSLFKALNDRKVAIQAALGRDYLDPRNVDDLMTLAPEGFIDWQPEPGNHWFRAATVDERALQAVLDGDRALTKDDLKEIVAMGGAKETWIIPGWLAETLTHFGVQPHVPGPIGALDRAIVRSTSAWKQYILNAPQRLFRYNFNNVSGDVDAATAYSPMIFREIPGAARDLWHYMFRRSAPEGTTRAALERDMQHAIELGVVDGGITAYEIPDITTQPAFRRLAEASPLEFGRILTGYFTYARELTQYRENLLRLAAFRFFQGKVRESRPIYAASNPARVRGERDPERRAALLARDLIGDYGAVSSFTQFTRMRLLPFFSFQEVNFKRYMRLMRNLPLEAGASERAARLGLVAGAKTAKGAAALAVRANLFFLTIALWNATMFPDEEDELRRRGRQGLTLIVGRNDDGSIATIRFEGAFADFLEWLHLSDYPEDVRDLASGAYEWRDKFVDAAQAPVAKLVQLWEPFSKLVYEQLTKRSLYPNPFRPQPIRDRGEHAARLLALDGLYRRVTGRPIPPGNPVARLLVYRTDPGEASYFEIRRLAAEYMDDTGRLRVGTDPTEKDNALYYYKRAVVWGDEAAAKKWRAEYVKLGGNLRSLKTSIARGGPLGAMSARERQGFLRTLDADEKAMLRMATVWYRRVYVGVRTGRARPAPSPAPTP